MKYRGTNIYTDGSRHRRGAACYTLIILCNDRLLCEITNAVSDSEVTAGQMEIEAICQAIAWVVGHPREAQPPYKLFTDYQPFVCLYNGPNGARRGGIVGRAILKGKEMGLEICYIAAHRQEHSGNKTCDITCRALCGAVIRYGEPALSLATGKAANIIGDQQSAE